MSAHPTLRSATAMAAALAVQSCAASAPPGPHALQVCSDRAGHRVDDQLCRSAATDTPYAWYYLDVGAPAPPVGASLGGGSPIATVGIAYITSTGETEASADPASQTSAETAGSPPADTVVEKSANGAFVVSGEVNGHPVTFVVDTGASEVVLSPADAAKLGLTPANLKYDRMYQTANGIGLGASFEASEIKVGAIRVTGVAASVNQAPMRYSLLGRSFLDRLNTFRVERGRLYLR